jgi:hypothetical protein
MRATAQGWCRVEAAGEPVQILAILLEHPGQLVTREELRERLWDGRHLYAVGREPHGQLSVYDRQSGQFVPYLNGISACFVDYSRDGQWVTYVSYPEGALWRSRIDGSERRQMTVPPLAVVNPRWSRMGN